MLNRGVIIVRPAQPFLDWASKLDDSGLVPGTAGERTVYLVPDFEDDDEAAQILELVFAEIFEREHVPILVSDGAFVGLITRIDILNYLRRKLT